MSESPGYANENEVVADLAGEAKMLGRLFSRKWHGKLEVDDLSQTALVAAIAAFRSYDPDLAQGRTMRNWIRSKMRFAIYDFVRLEMGRVGRRGRGESVEISIDNCPPALLAVEESSAMFAALDVPRLMQKIQPKVRDIVRRRHLEHETLAQIAATEGVHLSYIQHLDQKGLRAMRKAA